MSQNSALIINVELLTLASVCYCAHHPALIPPGAGVRGDRSGCNCEGPRAPGVTAACGGDRRRAREQGGLLPLHKSLTRAGRYGRRACGTHCTEPKSWWRPLRSRNNEHVHMQQIGHTHTRRWIYRAQPGSNTECTAGSVTWVRSICKRDVQETVLLDSSDTAFHLNVMLHRSAFPPV